MTTEVPPAGWYPDPSGGPGQRYWDGQAWRAETPQPSPGDISSPPGDQGTRRGRSPALITLVVVLVAVIVVGLVVIAVMLKNRHTTTPAPTAMSGHYLKTDTTSKGFSGSEDWYFTPCGDGCAKVASGPEAKPWGQANLVAGQWTLDAPGYSNCADGTRVPNANSQHFAWDPNTLTGTVQVTDVLAACGAQPGFHFTNSVQFKKVP
jgi:hypothetical protein